MRLAHHFYPFVHLRRVMTYTRKWRHAKHINRKYSTKRIISDMPFLFHFRRILDVFILTQRAWHFPPIDLFASSTFLWMNFTPWFIEWWWRAQKSSLPPPPRTSNPCIKCFIGTKCKFRKHLISECLFRFNFIVHPYFLMQKRFLKS